MVNGESRMMIVVCNFMLVTRHGVTASESIPIWMYGCNIVMLAESSVVVGGKCPVCLKHAEGLWCKCGGKVKEILRA